MSEELKSWTAVPPTPVAMHTVFLSDSIETTLRLIASELPEGWLVESDLNDLPPVHGHFPLINEVFYRVLSQLVEKMKEEVQELGVPGRRPWLQIRGDLKGASTVIEISPQYRGSKDALPTAFQFQMDHPVMSKCREYMMQMDGFIEINNALQYISPCVRLYFLNDPKEN